MHPNLTLFLKAETWYTRWEIVHSIKKQASWAELRLLRTSILVVSTGHAETSNEFRRGSSLQDNFASSYISESEHSPKSKPLWFPAFWVGILNLCGPLGACPVPQLSPEFESNGWPRWAFESNVQLTFPYHVFTSKVYGCLMTKIDS